MYYLGLNLCNSNLVSSRFPSLGILRLELENPRWNTYVGHWNSYVGISNVQRRYFNVGFFISAQIFAKFDDFYDLNECWTLEFLHRNSNVQHRYSNVGIPSPT